MPLLSQVNTHGPVHRFAACRAYALAFSALTGMRNEERAGWAVRVAHEAVLWQVCGAVLHRGQAASWEQAALSL